MHPGRPAGEGINWGIPGVARLPTARLHSDHACFCPSMPDTYILPLPGDRLRSRFNLASRPVITNHSPLSCFLSRFKRPAANHHSSEPPDGRTASLLFLL
jgi:hypothetical protein